MKSNDSGTTEQTHFDKTEMYQNDNEQVNPITPRKDLFPEKDNPPNYSFEPETQVESENISTRSKSFKPAIKTLVDLIDSTGVKLLQVTARKEGWEDKEIETLEQRARMEADTYAVIVDSGSRIAARYVKNEEYIDWACLFGGLTQWSMGLIAAIREIKANPKYVDAEQATEQPNEDGTQNS